MSTTALFALHYLYNITQIVSAAAVLFAVAVGIGWVFVGYDDPDVMRPWTRRAAIALLIAAPLMPIPGPENLWELRLSLVKLELSSPENVQKGTEEISRIAKALECKHLGTNCETKP